MLEQVGELHSSSVISRHPANPVLTAREVPYPAALVFNPGVTKYEGRYVMVFRNDYGSVDERRLEGTNLGLAYSDDGVRWQVEPQPCFELADDEMEIGMGQHGEAGGKCAEDDENYTVANSIHG